MDFIKESRSLCEKKETASIFGETEKVGIAIERYRVGGLTFRAKVPGEGSIFCWKSAYRNALGGAEEN